MVTCAFQLPQLPSFFGSESLLQAKDDSVIEALGILKLSDPRVKLQTRCGSGIRSLP